jgi:hypothetical protein
MRRSGAGIISHHISARPVDNTNGSTQPTYLTRMYLILLSPYWFEVPIKEEWLKVLLERVTGVDADGNKSVVSSELEPSEDRQR